MNNLLSILVKSIFNIIKKQISGVLQKSYEQDIENVSEANNAQKLLGSKSDIEDEEV